MAFTSAVRVLKVRENYFLLFYLWVCASKPYAEGYTAHVFKVYISVICDENHCCSYKMHQIY